MISKLPFKERLALFIQTYYSRAWIASGDLQRIVAAKTNYTPQNVGRRLRELENEGIVEVKYVKGHAHYRFKGAPSVKDLIARQLDWFERLPVAA